MNIVSRTKEKQIRLKREDFMENPYPLYESLRGISPIYKGSMLKQPGWFVTGYKEAALILKEPSFFTRIPLPRSTEKYGHLKRAQSKMMLYMNNHDHRKLRLLVNKGFTPKQVEEFKPLIEKITHSLLDELIVKKEFDVVSEFAFPLTSLVIATILGVPEEDRKRFRVWASALLQSIDFSRSHKTLEESDRLIGELNDYFTLVIDKKRKKPCNDLISKLIKEEDKITNEELIATSILLVIAGHETTVNLISNTVLAFAKHPAQWELLKSDSSLVAPSIEEVLRYESPTQLTARVAMKDTEIAGHQLTSGDQIYLMLGAANRDPEVFEKPNEFIISRKSIPHLSFGMGAHFCLGSTLARLEAQAALAALLQRLNTYELVSNQIKWRKLMGFRSLEQLRIKTFNTSK
ncbi:cytochrome P450 [Alkalihalophilus lindianensis]|uniref:Cytochrome P450 n=1 Tax=Alkalihalophilus lindianensis TaxID=1630542 RepID=A0ABU3X6U5_9BACI|nr:cytochrome P450 [Alkalihalophilus lindianensis]MDV2683589.1 cytochrome P450 [Alkalihalophilus lindianensis]